MDMVHLYVSIRFIIFSKLGPVILHYPSGCLVDGRCGRCHDIDRHSYDYMYRLSHTKIAGLMGASAGEISPSQAPKAKAARGFGEAGDLAKNHVLRWDFDGNFM